MVPGFTFLFRHCEGILNCNPVHPTELTVHFLAWVSATSSSQELAAQQEIIYPLRTGLKSESLRLQDRSTAFSPMGCPSFSLLTYHQMLLGRFCTSHHSLQTPCADIWNQPAVSSRQWLLTSSVLRRRTLACFWKSRSSFSSSYCLLRSCKATHPRCRKLCVIWTAVANCTLW